MSWSFGFETNVFVYKFPDEYLHKRSLVISTRDHWWPKMNDVQDNIFLCISIGYANIGYHGLGLRATSLSSTTDWRIFRIFWWQVQRIDGFFGFFDDKYSGLTDFRIFWWQVQRIDGLFGLVNWCYAQWFHKPICLGLKPKAKSESRLKPTDKMDLVTFRFLTLLALGFSPRLGNSVRNISYLMRSQHA